MYVLAIVLIVVSLVNTVKALPTVGERLIFPNPMQLDYPVKLQVNFEVMKATGDFKLIKRYGVVEVTTFVIDLPNKTLIKEMKDSAHSVRLTHVNLMRIKKLVKLEDKLQLLEVTMRPRDIYSKRKSMYIPDRQDIYVEYIGLQYGYGITDVMGLVELMNLIVVINYPQCKDIGLYEFYMEALNLDDNSVHNATRTVYLDLIAPQPLIAAYPNTGIYRVGQKVMIHCFVFTSMDEVVFNYSIKFKNAEKATPLPTSGRMFGYGYEQFPDFIKYDKVFFVGSDTCSSMTKYYRFSAAMQFIIRKSDLLDAEITCKSTARVTRMEPDIHKNISAEETNQESLRLSLCSKYPQRPCMEGRKAATEIAATAKFIENRSGDEEPGVDVVYLGLVTGLMVVSLLGLVHAVIFGPKFTHAMLQ